MNITDAELNLQGETPAVETVRQLTTADHQAYLDVVASAWPGLSGLQQHDFIAKAMMGNLVGAFSPNGLLLGFSDNVLNVNGKEMLVHMIASRQSSHDHGVGTQIMRHNISLIRDGVLPPSYEQISLTSDPLESRNVRFYLKKTGFTTNEYKNDAYHNVGSGEGSTTHAGLAQDRFHYRVYPNSPWYENRILPSNEVYEAIINSGTGVIGYGEESADTTGITFVEIPYDMQALKQENLELAQNWRSWQRQILTGLFVNNYTAVDHVLTTDGRSFMVLVPDFSHDDPESIIKHI